MNVLVLHGDESERMRVVSHLEELGSVETRHFAGGRSARKGCRTFHPDIVIVDRSVLDVATSELIAKLRQTVRQLRLVLITVASATPAESSLGQKPDAVLWSPFSRWEFQQAVQDQIAALGETTQIS